MRQPDLPRVYTRGDQLKLLQRLELTPFVCADGSSVRPLIQKAVLRAIDDHADLNNNRDCTAAQATLAREANCSEKGVERAVEALTARRLITNERPSRLSTNRHRPVFTEIDLWVSKQPIRPKRNVTMTDRSRPSDGSGADPVTVQSRHHDGSGTDPVTVRTRHHDGQNDKETKSLIATSTATLNEPWLRLRDELDLKGMKMATPATVAAHNAGWSIEYTRELVCFALEPSKRGEPHGIGHLCRWMSQSTLPPFDQEAGERRYAARLSDHRVQADAIRERVRHECEARNRRPEVTSGYIYRALVDADREEFASDEERVAGNLLDEWDAKRRQKHDCA